MLDRVGALRAPDHPRTRHRLPRAGLTAPAHERMRNRSPRSAYAGRGWSPRLSRRGLPLRIAAPCSFLAPHGRGEFYRTREPERLRCFGHPQQSALAHAARRRIRRLNRALIHSERLNCSKLWGGLRESLVHMTDEQLVARLRTSARAQFPDECDIDDIIQEALMAALASGAPPEGMLDAADTHLRELRTRYHWERRRLAPVPVQPQLEEAARLAPVRRRQSRNRRPAGVLRPALRPRSSALANGAPIDFRLEERVPFRVC